jgi:hypothetical protein
MLLTTAEYMKTSGLFVRVWRNEFIRVICDRLVSVEVGSALLFTLHQRNIMLHAIIQA